MSLSDLFGESPVPRPARRRPCVRVDQAAEVLEDRVLLTPSFDRPEDITGFQNGRWVTSIGTLERTATQQFTSQWDQWANVAWTFLGEGDFNINPNVNPPTGRGDGLTDVIGLYQGAWYVGLSTGASYSRFLDGRSPLWAQWNPNVSWQDVRVADLNGDGRSDIFARAGNQFYAALANATGTGFGPAALWAPTNGIVSQSLFLADVNADGAADLVRFTAGGNWFVNISTGGSFTNVQVWAVWDVSTPWTGLTMADMNGDGNADAVGFRNGQWQVSLSSGASFNNPFRWATFTPANWLDARVGDFDHNGVLDIAARYSGQWWVGLSSIVNNTLTVKTTYWGSWSNAVVWQDVRVGDFDGDGFDDIAGRYQTQWYVDFTTFSAAQNKLVFATVAWANWANFGTGGTWLAVATVQANNLPAAAAPPASGGAVAAMTFAATAQQKDSLLLWARAWDDELERSLYGVGA